MYANNQLKGVTFFSSYLQQPLAFVCFCSPRKKKWLCVHKSFTLIENAITANEIKGDVCGAGQTPNPLKKTPECDID